MLRSPSISARAIATVAALALVVCLTACKSDKARSSDERTSASQDNGAAGLDNGAAGISAESGAVIMIRAGDGTAAGRMMAVLAELEPPRLDGSPACADYARNTSTLFTDLGHQLRRMRDRKTSGISMEELARFAAWLDARSGTLDQISRAKALVDDELGRAHRELAGAVADLSTALGDAYGTPGQKPDPEQALRLGNAADNFAVALRALEARCQTP